MRKECMDLLLAEMIKDQTIYTITADLGFGVLDKIRDSVPDRFFNVGAAEQLLIGVGIGLAEEGKIPVCYSMSSFILYRPFEFLRNYVNAENIPVKLIGSGRDKDYSHDGLSHWAEDADDVLKILPNIEVYKPNNISELETMFPKFLYSKKPSFISLLRKS
jgi:transketolase